LVRIFEKIGPDLVWILILLVWILDCLIELIKANSYKYKRRPNEEDLKEDGKKLIITYSDYSMAWVNFTYLLEEKKENTFAITLL